MTRKLSAATLICTTMTLNGAVTLTSLDDLTVDYLMHIFVRLSRLGQLDHCHIGSSRSSVWNHLIFLLDFLFWFPWIVFACFKQRESFCLCSLWFLFCFIGLSNNGWKLTRLIKNVFSIRFLFRVDMYPLQRSSIFACDLVSSPEHAHQVTQVLFRYPWSFRNIGSVFVSIRLVVLLGLLIDEDRSTRLQRLSERIKDRQSKKKNGKQEEAEQQQQ